MSRSHCGDGWTRSSSGSVHVTVRNVDDAAGEAYLADAAGRILAEADPVGSGSRGTLDADLAPGSYHLVCAMDDSDPVNGPPVTVAGVSTGSGPAVQPVTSGDLAPYAIANTRQVTARLSTFRGQVADLATALRGGDRGAAQRDWLVSYRTWNTLGVAYGEFGGAADAVAGLPYGLPRGTADPGWTGLHRIEYGLWH